MTKIELALEISKVTNFSEDFLMKQSIEELQETYEKLIKKQDKLIKVTPVTKKFFTCSVCNSGKNLKDITTGADENRTTTLRLCEECIKELKAKL